MNRLTLLTLTAVTTLTVMQTEAKACIHEDMEVVASFYPKYLHRRADWNGMKYWRGELVRGECVHNIEARLLASDEYYQVHGACPHGFVHGLLDDVLEGPVCPKLEARWIARLQGCGCRLTVAREVLALRDAPPVVVAPPVPSYRPTPTGYFPGRRGPDFGRDVVVVPPARTVVVPPPVVVPTHRHASARPAVSVQINLPFRFGR